MAKKETRPPADVGRLWNDTKNALLDFQINELREVIKLIEGRIADLEKQKQ